MNLKKGIKKMTDNELLDPGEDNENIKINIDNIEEDLTPNSNLFKDFCKYYVPPQERNPFSPGWKDKMKILEKIIQEKSN